MKQFSQGASVEYGRFVRGEISLQEYVSSHRKNDVEVMRVRDERTDPPAWLHRLNWIEANSTDATARADAGAIKHELRYVARRIYLGVVLLAVAAIGSFGVNVFVVLKYVL